MPILAKSNAGSTSGALIASKEVNIEDLHTAEPFKSAFEIDEKTLSEVVESIKKNGFHKEEPIVVWKEKDKVVDGHTRLAAAIKAGLLSVPVHYKSFNSESEALLYTFERQQKRRQTSDSQLLNVAMRLNLESKNDYGTGSKAETLTNTFDISKTKAKQTIKVAKDPEKRDEVLKGKKSIRAAYNEIQDEEKSKKTEKIPESENNTDWDIFDSELNEMPEPEPDSKVLISDVKTAAQIIKLLVDANFVSAAHHVYVRMPDSINTYLQEDIKGSLR